MKILVFGTFDHFHPGHRFVLEQARARGSVFVVVARDDNVERIKGHRPDEAEDIRHDAVQAAVPRATVILGDPEDFLVPVRTIKPDLILLGYDQKLPPGVTEDQFLCPIERLPAFEPALYKSSKMR